MRTADRVALGRSGGRGTLTALALAALLPSGVVGAQTPRAESTAGAPDPLCFRGRPLPRCASFVVLESGFAIGPPHSSRRPPANLVWEAGWMRNTSPASAYGGTLIALFDEDERVMMGAKFRYRRWLNDALALDLAPGFVVETGGDSFAPIGPGFVAHVGLSAWDLAELVVQLEWMGLPAENVATNAGTVFIGLRAGSYPALAVGPFLAWFADWVTQFD
jgi:hypothetical protein